VYGFSGYIVVFLSAAQSRNIVDDRPQYLLITAVQKIPFVTSIIGAS